MCASFATAVSDGAPCIVVTARRRTILGESPSPTLPPSAPTRLLAVMDDAHDPNRDDAARRSEPHLVSRLATEQRPTDRTVRRHALSHDIRVLIRHDIKLRLA